MDLVEHRALTIGNAQGSRGLASAGGSAGTTTISAIVNSITGTTSAPRSLF